MRHFYKRRQLAVLAVAITVLGIAFPTKNQEPSTPPGYKHSPIHVHRNPDGTAAHGIRNEWLSGNWSGYELANFQTGQKYKQAQMTWVVPTVTYGASSDSTSSSEYSANWVGIGGFCEDRLCTRGDKTLIQLGTEQDVSPSPNGATQYYAWYEMLPAAETPLPANYVVKPRDTMTASLTCINACSAKTQTWQLTMSNLTEHWTWSQEFSYASSMLSADWIEEAPYEGGILPLADFGTASFSATGGVNNGQTPSLSLSANGIAMEDPWGQTSAPSSPTLANFDACWNYTTLTSCPMP
jgi:Peptidase A4 family